MVLGFIHPIFHFWSLLATKLQKYYITFVYILQGKMGKTEKTRKRISKLKWPKYQKPKTKRQKYGMNKIKEFLGQIWTCCFSTLKLNRLPMFCDVYYTYIISSIYIFWKLDGKQVPKYVLTALLWLIKNWHRSVGIHSFEGIHKFLLLCICFIPNLPNLVIISFIKIFLFSKVPRLDPIDSHEIWILL